MNPDDAFERILAALYEAALDDTRWSAATSLIEDTLDASGTAIGVVEVGEDDVLNARVHFARFLRRGDSVQDLMHEYFTVYHPIDEAMPRARRLPDARLVHVRELYTEDELKTSVAYNEGLARLGGQNGLQTQMRGPDGTRIVWSISDPDRSRVWETDQLRFMERLLPHIRRSVIVRQTLAAAEALGTGLAGLLDNDRIGVVQLDRGGRVLEANAPGLEILRRGDGLVEGDGTLDAVLPADRSRLRRLLGARAAGFPGRGPERRLDDGATPLGAVAAGAARHAGGRRGGGFRRAPGGGAGAAGRPGAASTDQRGTCGGDARPDAVRGPDGGAAGRGAEDAARSPRSRAGARTMCAG